MRASCVCDVCTKGDGSGIGEPKAKSEEGGGGGDEDEEEDDDDDDDADDVDGGSNGDDGEDNDEGNWLWRRIKSLNSGPLSIHKALLRKLFGAPEPVPNLTMRSHSGWVSAERSRDVIATVAHLLRSLLAAYHVLSFLRPSSARHA